MPELNNGQIEDTAKLLRKIGQGIELYRAAQGGDKGAELVAPDLRELRDFAEQALKQSDRLLNLLQPAEPGADLLQGLTWVPLAPEPDQAAQLPPGARIAQAEVRDGLLNAFFGPGGNGFVMSVGHARSAVLGRDGIPEGRTPTLAEIASAYRYFYPAPSVALVSDRPATMRPIMALLVNGRDFGNIVQLISVNVDFHGAQSPALQGQTQ